MAGALADAGCDVVGVLGRGDDIARAAQGVDALVIATDDRSVETVATIVEPRAGTVVMHVSGSLGLDVLHPHERRASMHPLVPLPDPRVGRIRLRSGVTFGVSGDPLAAQLARVLGGRVLRIDAEDRATYHAAACIASNHVVALLAQAERVGAPSGLDLSALVDLARFALEDVGRVGPAEALTGPAARDDNCTIHRHREALDPEELPGYDAGVLMARRLARAKTGSSAGDAPSMEAVSCS